MLEKVEKTAELVFLGTVVQVDTRVDDDEEGPKSMLRKNNENH